jgi:hypothetical protein
MAAAYRLPGSATTQVNVSVPVRQINATFCQQIFDVPKAEGKPEIQPNGVLNDHGGKSVSGIGDFLHPATLLSRQPQVTLLV